MTYDIRFIRTLAADSDPVADKSPNKVIITVDSETEITLYGEGCGSYQLAVRCIRPETITEGYNPEAILREALGDGWNNAAGFGQALTWAEPKTIAHLVMNVIDNQ